jgi:hypothetical protein
MQNNITACHFCFLKKLKDSYVLLVYAKISLCSYTRHQPSNRACGEVRGTAVAQEGEGDFSLNILYILLLFFYDTGV